MIPLDPAVYKSKPPALDAPGASICSVNGQGRVMSTRGNEDQSKTMKVMRMPGGRFDLYRRADPDPRREIRKSVGEREEGGGEGGLRLVQQQEKLLQVNRGEGNAIQIRPTVLSYLSREDRPVSICEHRRQTDPQPISHKAE